MDDTKDLTDGSSRRRRRSVDHSGHDRLLDVPGSWPTRRRSCEVPEASTPSRIPVRSPASTPTMPRRLTPFTLARLNKTSQSLRSLDRDDADSIGGRSSIASCDCDHPHFPGNGTTYSGRTKRYVVHCSSSHSCSPEEYLTPTQRANQTIRKLKAELAASQAELTDREREIARLTREIVQLRLRKLEESQDDDSSPDSRMAGTPTRIDIFRNGPESTRIYERSPGARLSSRNIPNGIDGYRERSPGGGLRDYRDVSPSTMSKDYRDYPSPPSHSDSRPSSSRAGEYRDYMDRLPIRDCSFRDGISPSDYSDGVVKEYQGGMRPSSSQDYRDEHSAFRPIRFSNDLSEPPPFPIPTLPHQGHGSSCGSEVAASLADSGHFEELSPHHSPKTSALEKEIESLKLEHLAHVKQMKTSTDLIIEELQTKIREANIRCEELKPQLEDARVRLAELEKEKEDLQIKYDENELKHKEDYLKMYNKGQQAAIIQSDASTSDGPPSDIPSLLKQLEVTRQELESVKDDGYWDRAHRISAKEAVSIWNLSRKTMYRRCLESRKTKSQEDAEITLKFLKSAIFYFLTDRENSGGHLAAIMSILGFNDEERAAIDRMSWTWK